jgi:osmotically-inducible protein OsmY
MAIPTLVQCSADSGIKDSVLAELKWDSRVQDTDVGVQVHKGVVTLTGTLSAHAKRVAAVRAAHRVPGVRDVVDQLRVELPEAWTRTDEDLARAIRHALEWDVFVPDRWINSTISNGVVTLTGTVDNWSERAEAERAVARLIGVRAVLNEIVVKAEPADSEEIRRRIVEALERHCAKDISRLEISIRDGVATISGVLPSWTEKSVIDRVIACSPGICRVEDRTTIDPCA